MQKKYKTCGFWPLLGLVTLVVHNFSLRVLAEWTSDVRADPMLAITLSLAARLSGAEGMKTYRKGIFFAFF